MNRMTPNQRAAVTMLANGHRPRKVTLAALIDRGLAVGPLDSPSLTRDGRYYAEHHTLPA